jgi:hypothetical protein
VGWENYWTPTELAGKQALFSQLGGCPQWPAQFMLRRAYRTVATIFLDSNTPVKTEVLWGPGGIERLWWWDTTDTALPAVCGNVLYRRCGSGVSRASASNA